MIFLSSTDHDTYALWIASWLIQRVLIFWYQPSRCLQPLVMGPKYPWLSFFDHYCCNFSNTPFFYMTCLSSIAFQFSAALPLLQMKKNCMMMADISNIIHGIFHGWWQIHLSDYKSVLKTYNPSNNPLKPSQQTCTHRKNKHILSVEYKASMAT